MTATLAVGDHYVALGSSFAAGPGVGVRAPGSPRRAGRSSTNYAHLVAARLGLELDDRTFSGATTAQLLGTGARGRPGQIDAIRSRTRLVTVTTGGNDVGYLPGLVAASLPAAASLVPALGRARAATDDPERLGRALLRLEDDLTRLVREVQARAASCTVVLVGYLTVLPSDATVSTAPLPAGVADWGREVARRLAETTARVARDTGVGYADVPQLSRGHHAWSAEPWTRRFHLTLRGGAPYHPDAAGMTAVADLLVSTLSR